MSLPSSLFVSFESHESMYLQNNDEDGCCFVSSIVNAGHLSIGCPCLFQDGGGGVGNGGGAVYSVQTCKLIYSSTKITSDIALKIRCFVCLLLSECWCCLVQLCVR